MVGARPSIRTDVDFLAPRLRPEDLAEVRANSGHDAKTTLLLGHLLSDQSYTMVGYEGDPVGMFGVCPTQTEQVGAVWMLCTEDLVRHTVPFLRNCRKGGWLERLHQDYPILTNHVDERNIVHIRWLQWMGFTFVMRHPLFGFEQRPFLEFVRLNPNV